MFNIKNSSIFQTYSQRNDRFQLALSNFRQLVENKNRITPLDIKNFDKIKLSKFHEIALKIFVKLRKIVGLESKNLKNILENQKTIEGIYYFYNKISNLYPTLDNENQFPFVFIAGKLDLIATRYQFKAIKAEYYTSHLTQLEKIEDVNQSSVEDIELNISKKVKTILYNIAEIYSDGKPNKKKALINNFESLVAKVSKMTNAEGQNVIQQLNVFYIKKQSYYSQLAKLHVIQQKLEQNLILDFSQLQKEFNSLSAETLASIDLSELQNALPAEKIAIVSKAIEMKYASIKKIDEAFDELLNKVHDDLTIYEVSASRLLEEISPDILKKPINVTMIGVEYTGLVKEGGLAEALEGMTKAMKSQHPDNKVRLIFPKFNIFPKNIQDKLNLVAPKMHMSSNGKPFNVYTLVIDEVEYNFIDDPSFVLTGDKPTIYAGPDEILKTRFATFSGLAADFVKTVKTDIIHLHDWHVAGVALKLHKDNAQKKDDIPPIVFTYHNNSRGSQGRFAGGIYNYEPVIQGLIESGMASENVNAFVEVIKKADAVTTVSETFGIESQDMSHGEGVSFATREAAEAGKLTGIINGSNPHSWNPEKDQNLINWKDPETQQSINLSYGLNDSDAQIIEKKEICKTQLEKWVSQNFPQAKIDFTKPLVTYVGRLDSYQKGLDKLEEAIRETIKNGGQFIVMGSLEDPNATLILDKLQSKYKKGVLFIRDYKDSNGRYHFQQGDATRQGCGSLVRAASDFLFIPSKFEPCGLIQFEGWLFGSLAIGSKVGGLADSIIPPSKNLEGFNGFLFNRDSDGEDSIQNAIKIALTTWKNYTKEEKGSLVRRLIEDGRKYSWSTSPSGYSPIEKYRFVYEKAKKNAKLRDTISSNNINLLARLNQIRDKSLIHHQKANRYEQMEEEYNQYFYSKNFKFKKLEKMYKALPEFLRLQVPSPYGHKLNFKTYETLGAHLSQNGVDFSVEAPQAKTVEVKVFDANGKATIHPLKKLDNGNWTGTVLDLKAGTKYQFIVNGQVKLDPVGLNHVPNPTPVEPPCSVVVDRTAHVWQDNQWMTSRVNNTGKPAPTSIYEIHPLFWKKKDGQFLNYREIADELVKHCKDVGYTHVELMGILEHPDQRSWGYQVTGFFAPNSKMGSPEDFKYLVDKLHQNNIGVYLDWIPAHFAKDPYALSKFDGSNQYQPSKWALLFSLRNIAFRWGTHFFDFSKKPVRNFLTSSAAFWLKEMHIDGLRVDAVRSILLSEKAADSQRFLRDLNAVVHREFPGVMMIAEDYSGTIKTTQATAVGGLGFDQKWNIGWMKHSMDYFSKKPKDRPEYYHKIITAIDGDTFHKMILAISHDEVTKEMGSLFEKNPNLTIEEKLANLRAFFSFIMSVPGKKLMFMGSEIGIEKGWNDFIDQEKGVLDSSIREKEEKSKKAISRLNAIYKGYKPFWQHDNNGHDLIWIEKNDPQKLIHAYRRISDEGGSIACLHNFSDTDVKEFEVMFKNEELLDDLEKLAIEWKKKDKDKKIVKLSEGEAKILAELSHYPFIAKKIAGNQKLQNDFFEEIFKNNGLLKDFLAKHGIKNFDKAPKEIFNSDDPDFGGKERLNKDIELIKDEQGSISGYKVRIPPLSSVFISE